MATHCVLAQALLVTSKVERDINYNRFIHEVPHEIGGGITYSSLSTPKINVGNNNQNLRKSRYQSFSVQFLLVFYFWSDTFTAIVVTI